MSVWQMRQKIIRTARQKHLDLDKKQKNFEEESDGKDERTKENCW